MNSEKGNLQQFQDIEITSRGVRNDMKKEQQGRLHKRTIAVRKQKEFKKRYDNRGRLLKADEFTELCQVLEGIFTAGDKNIEGGLASHSQLTTETMYRSAVNNLFMHQAREILLQVAPPNFSISLSSCFNYTDSYKENSSATEASCRKKH